LRTRSVTVDTLCLDSRVEAQSLAASRSPRAGPCPPRRPSSTPCLGDNPSTNSRPTVAVPPPLHWIPRGHQDTRMQGPGIPIGDTGSLSPVHIFIHIGPTHRSMRVSSRLPRDPHVTDLKYWPQIIWTPPVRLWLPVPPQGSVAHFRAISDFQAGSTGSTPVRAATNSAGNTPPPISRRSLSSAG
jgi:hypothetical protein